MCYCQLYWKKFENRKIVTICLQTHISKLMCTVMDTDDLRIIRRIFNILNIHRKTNIIFWNVSNQFYNDNLSFKNVNYNRQNQWKKTFQIIIMLLVKTLQWATTYRIPISEVVRSETFRMVFFFSSKHMDVTKFH